MSNPTQFNRADGKGYDFVAEIGASAEIGSQEPAGRGQRSSLGAFRSWRTLEAGRRARAVKRC